jgi:hypothetical protein
MAFHSSSDERFLASPLFNADVSSSISLFGPPLVLADFGAPIFSYPVICPARMLLKTVEVYRNVCKLASIPIVEGHRPIFEIAVDARRAPTYLQAV